jgi:hypothetical protein
MVGKAKTKPKPKTKTLQNSKGDTCLYLKPIYNVINYASMIIDIMSAITNLRDQWEKFHLQ